MHVTALLTAEARTWIGMEIDIPRAEISVRDVERYIVGCGGSEALLGGIALANVSTDSRVPPLIYQALTGPVAPRRDLTGDGSTAERRPPIGDGQGMAGETEVRFHRPLRVGDALNGRRRLLSLEEKDGRRRRFVVSTWLTEYRGDDGELLITETFRQLLF
jgi:hydroxyacyl-ACP dehydratase HTD2-like protein with hotdog domain